ncbi:MAG: hypothetical protein QGH15_13630 [Kiritimatiellia bacterium]|jgi:hypothetical protein|nr:hypothetical protein [Kiritimatiellia bacterium]
MRNITGISQRVALLFVSVFACTVYAASPELDKAKSDGAEGRVTIRVVNSQALPVKGAHISAGFYKPKRSNAVIEGQTDTNGVFVATGKSTSDMRYTITKRGFYKTSSTYNFYRHRGSPPVVNGRWQPWNPLVPVLLKEKKNPISMHARSVDTVIPALDLPLGFDAEKGDWVTPYGQGTVSDFVFTYSSEVQNPWTFSKTLAIACTGEMDGIQQVALNVTSDLGSEHQAPQEGYQKEFALSYMRTRKKVLEENALKANQYLAFRVRTVLDENGKIVSAYYGKLYPPLKYGLMGKEHRLMFTCYFNPEGTRNIEFDPEKNLSAPLTRKERAWRP